MKMVCLHSLFYKFAEYAAFGIAFHPFYNTEGLLKMLAHRNSTMQWQQSTKAGFFELLTFVLEKILYIFRKIL